MAGEHEDQCHKEERERDRAADDGTLAVSVGNVHRPAPPIVQFPVAGTGLEPVREITSHRILSRTQT